MSHIIQSGGDAATPMDVDDLAPTFATADADAAVPPLLNLAIPLLDVVVEEFRAGAREVGITSGTPLVAILRALAGVASPTIDVEKQDVAPIITVATRAPTV